MLAQAQKITIFAIFALAGPGCFHDSYDGPADVGTETGSDADNGSSSGDGDGDGDTGTSTGNGAGDGDGDGDGDTSGAVTDPYTPCLDDGDCDDPWPTCLVAEGSVAGFCTGPCALAADCLPPPTGTAAAVCHGLGLCMLSCNVEKPCPEGMACTSEEFDGWPVGGVCTWP